MNIQKVNEPVRGNFEELSSTLWTVLSETRRLVQVSKYEYCDPDHCPSVWTHSHYVQKAVQSAQKANDSLGDQGLANMSFSSAGIVMRALDQLAADCESYFDAIDPKNTIGLSAAEFVEKGCEATSAIVNSCKRIPNRSFGKVRREIA